MTSYNARPRYDDLARTVFPDYERNYVHAGQGQGTPPDVVMHDLENLAYLDEALKGLQANLEARHHLPDAMQLPTGAKRDH